MWHPQQEGSEDGSDQPAAQIPPIVELLEDEPPYAAPARDEMLAALARQGIPIDERTLRRYHLALGARGSWSCGRERTGKTWLAEAYARSSAPPRRSNWLLASGGGCRDHITWCKTR